MNKHESQFKYTYATTIVSDLITLPILLFICSCSCWCCWGDLFKRA